MSYIDELNKANKSVESSDDLLRGINLETVDKDGKIYIVASVIAKSIFDIFVRYKESGYSTEGDNKYHSLGILSFWSDSFEMKVSYVDQSIEAIVKNNDMSCYVGSVKVSVDNSTSIEDIISNLSTFLEKEGIYTDTKLFFNELVTAFGDYSLSQYPSLFTGVVIKGYDKNKDYSESYITYDENEPKYLWDNRKHILSDTLRVIEEDWSDYVEADVRESKGYKVFMAIHFINSLVYRLYLPFVRTKGTAEVVLINSEFGSTSSRKLKLELLIRDTRYVFIRITKRKDTDTESCEFKLNGSKSYMRIEEDYRKFMDNSRKIGIGKDEIIYLISNFIKLNLFDYDKDDNGTLNNIFKRESDRCYDVVREAIKSKDANVKCKFDFSV